MATKADLEKQIKTFKDEIRRLRSEAKTVESTIEGLTDDAYALNKEGRDFHLVKILFDVEKKQAVIEKVTNIGPSLAMASFKIKEAVIDRLVKIKKGK